MIQVQEAPREHYPWIAKRAGIVIEGGFRALEAVDGHTILGMVGYDGWMPNSCAMHVAIDKPIAVRRLLKPAFRRAFEHVGVIRGYVLSNNQKALDFDLHLGFTRIGFIPDCWSEGVGVHILAMRRDECRWLG